MNTKVYYFGVDTPGDCIAKERLDDQYVHSQCPVVHHKNNRVFIAYSPVDFIAKVDRTPEGNRIECNRQDLLKVEDSYFTAPLPVLQVKSPMFMFYTEEDNVWFEFDAHPMTSLNNNFIAVGGWFNLSNWSRASSTAITLVNEKKSVIIEKGDPLFRVSFYPPNLDDSIILKKETNTEVVNQWVEAHSKKSEEDWRPRLFSKTKTESKCPFSFLFK